MKHPTNRRFARCAIGVALSAIGAGAWAASPYPAVPVTTSATVTPNVLLVIDNSGSMDSPPEGGGNKKIVTARNAANTLVTNNPNIRWGVFSFDPNNNETSGVLQAPVGSSAATLKTAIDGLGPDTWTPLGETLFEVGRYWGGQTSYYGKTRNAPGGQYTSPIQYRCQKNFNIVITDGMSTKDDRLPGNKTWNTVGYPTLDTSGNRVNYNFGICKNTTAINSNISCPAILEGASNNAGSGFGSNDERIRSLRDVSAYLYDKDMRYNLATTDADGRSWDDPKFPRQNVQTYTVGFDIGSTQSDKVIARDVLRATASVGRGEFFLAGNETDLSKALNSAISSMINSLSNAGGVASSTTALQSGSKLFQPLYNPTGWFGELLCFDLDTSGATTACANPKATIPSAASRKLFSSKVVGGVTTPFVFNDTAGFGAMTAAQKLSLGGTAVKQKEVINFIRGTNVAGYRSRPKGLLGDMIDSQPLVLTAPNGESSDSDYSAFKAAQASRNMVFVGANDGMLHGFSTSNMAEFFGYIPSPVYPNLALLGKTDYGEGSSSPHAYFVNGVLRQQDIKVGSGWQTILVGGLAQGGQGYFALNATSTSTLTAASGVKWEFTDQHDSAMGYSFGAPLIYTVRTSATTAVPAVILANGYEADYDDVAQGGVKAAAKSSALYIVRASDGVLLKKIPVPDVLGVSQGAGLSSPVGVDFGQDGVLDYVYAGDINGKLWRFDLTGETPADFGVANNPIFDAGSSKPIVLRPAVYPVNKTDVNGNTVSVGNLILFGTGKLLTETDRTNTDAQAFYAVLDKMGSNPATITLSQLQEQTVTSVEAMSSVAKSGNYRVMSDNVVDLLGNTATSKLGWYFNLPVSSERLMTAPLIVGGKLFFGTGIPVSGEQCSPGKGWLMGLNILTGGVVKSLGNKPYSFLDINDDGKTNDGDKLTSGKFGSGYELGGMPTELTFISKTTSVSTTGSVGGALGAAGSSVALGESNLTGVYTANAAGTVSAGNSTGREVVSATGEIYFPTTSGGANGGGFGGGGGESGGSGVPGAGVKLETTLWREIK